MISESVVKELRTIEQAKGLLRAEDVVAAARASNSPLHHFFTWDDSEAARCYRLSEARTLITSVVEYRQLGARTIEIQSWVSLTPDRTREGGGYRSVTSILESSTLRDQRLGDLVVELERLRVKLDEFQELRKVAMEINSVVQKYPPRGTRSSRRSAAITGA